MKRKLLLTTFTIAVVLAMTTSPLHAPPVGAAPDFCADCADSCWTHANTGENKAYYWECVDSNGDTEANRQFCYNTVILGYYNACIAVDCNAAGCSVVRKAPRSAPGDN